ncbi:nucleotide exchange factor GrpE [Candidatus Gottesmanbacteria bacterium RBG_16_37_8]|uniref:Protein GrpE n=1 Tax=Candidatus Gottesmanbacteria bacterium RBG_16_37_8 TaxID=1798371 RepID=A0A1F5YQ98_9BACT|nr:MAG: nucleotide exchange factor GrpE [Candidatus Gottesmanbacteria bacterium RBG_16_37_8]
MKIRRGKIEAISDKDKLDSYKKEIEEWKSKYLRALADYQNLERRNREIAVLNKKSAARDFVLKLLPVIDDLIYAQKEIKNPGLQLIIDKLDAVLKSEDVQRVDCLGRKFTPSMMECVGIKEGEKEGLVVSQVRPAYLASGEVLQTSQVIVGQEKTEKSEADLEIN